MRWIQQREQRITARLRAFPWSILAYAIRAPLALLDTALFVRALAKRDEGLLTLHTGSEDTARWLLGRSEAKVGGPTAPPMPPPPASSSDMRG